MRCIRRHNQIKFLNIVFTGLVFFLLLETRCGSAQGLGHSAFKGSHNSYDKSVSITSQIDDWNTWFIEIDICMQNNVLKVKHLCSDSDYGLDNALEQIASAASSQERLTFIWFDIKDQTIPVPPFLCQCKFDDDQPYEVIDLLVAKLKSYFGNKLYRASEWRNIDGKVWPSYQELLDRGKRYIAIFDENDAKPVDDYLFMSEASYADATNTTKHPVQHIGFISLDSFDMGGVTIDPNDQYLWRRYDLTTSSEWVSAANLGFNILCTDYIDQPWSFAHVQAPSPIVVDNNASTSEYGTFGNPFHSVSAAVSLEKICPGTRILIHAGVYDEPPFQITKNLELLAIDGLVEIK
ncbi:conserved hypothetical protein [delta proteobacterium NaphS2]|nr:conserved hypothetical protein [delta proteobacterium NaphS2]